MKTTERSASFPPGEANSYQNVHRFGFLREGRSCRSRNGMEKGPRNGK